MAHSAAVLLLTGWDQCGSFMTKKRQSCACPHPSLHTTGKCSAMPRLNARDYAQNSVREVLTSPGPHPPIHDPNTPTLSSLPFLFTTPCTFLLPRVQPQGPQRVPISPGCTTSVLIWLLFSFDLKQGEILAAIKSSSHTWRGTRSLLSVCSGSRFP